MRGLDPGLPLYVVAEFPPPAGIWIPYHVRRSFWENWARSRAALAGQCVRFSGILLQPRMPYWRMRLIGLLTSPAGFIAYNENLNHFMLRPRSAWTMVRHFWWRAGNFVRWHTRPGGGIYTFLWRLKHPGAFRRPVLYALARAAGAVAAISKALLPAGPSFRRVEPGAPGVSVVIPSRNGRELLAGLLPGVVRDLEGIPSEIIIVDNGSDDGTAAFLSEHYPRAVVELSAAPLSFARAANRGLGRARYSRLCLLNNDMIIEPGFFAALLDAFDQVPDLYAATAQIFFPEGARRQETGKAVMPRPPAGLDFPVRCDAPVEGEDLSYVLYGSGGCSLYSTEKLKRLGGLGEMYEPAYVEDLDAGYRAWLRGWPTVFAARARVLHLHRATTSRYYSDAELARVLEVNYLRFLARGVASPTLFRKLWREEVGRLNRLAARVDDPPPEAVAALGAAWRAPAWIEAPPVKREDEERIFALGSGAVAVYPGRPARGRPVVLVASPYLPFPLSHGGAVRMYNLMRRAAADFDQVLVAFADQQATPPAEVLEIVSEVVLVRRAGSHSRPATRRPDVVEEFDASSFHAALGQSARKWRPAVAQLEFTQMAQYARDCAPARTILVEHDVTFDLYAQLLAQGDDWELRRQYRRWREFETGAWRAVDCVVTMSEKDRRTIRGARAVTLANGVDLERFRPSAAPPEARRILFIGSFAHLPNILAVQFFLEQVWPRLDALEPVLHIIAGARHRYFLEHYRDRVQVNLDRPRLEVDDFVADPRPAYERATVVIAPLVASAGTNIKIMEAMAMGKAIVSTPAGVNGLDLAWGSDVLVASTGQEMARAIGELIAEPGRRSEIERQARATAQARYDWDAIARQQRRLYESLIPSTA